MIKNEELILSYIKQAVKELIERDSFINGWTFKPTQKAALHAYDSFLNDPDLTIKQKLKGFFEIPTGVGKTALFGAIIGSIHRISSEENDNFRTMIVVPTNQLVDQTHDELHGIDPFLNGNIGLYDGWRKKLSQPITIITYDSWTTLLEKGRVSAENTDLLISDEAHRGTSERRTDNIFQAYDEQEEHTTARFAFTATSRFDKEKTVHRTHENEIFNRKIANSVRDGELAEYISTQFYIIRVVPDSKSLGPVFETASDINGELKQAVRKEGWNKRMIALLREGRDKVTGDLLSDNQSAFFVADTKQANRLEAQLNADPVLKKMAEDRGMYGVAAAIHSKILPQKLNRQRMADYKAGKYLVAVGDSQFKEGFDHPPLKNIFDFPRTSLVDKSQIIGRGARRWWNESKERFEGMTFIDSIVYVGSEDPKEDERLRKNALADATLASDILEDNFVLRSGSKAKLKPSEQNDASSIFLEDPSVEEYSSLESLHLIQAERNKLKAENQARKEKREGHIEITEEIRTKLQSEVHRTGLKGRAIYTKLNPAPEGLTGSIAGNITAGAVKSARTEWIDELLAVYEKQPDSVLEKSVPIPKETQKQLAKEAERTGLGGDAIVARLLQPVEGLTGGKVHSYISGSVKSAPKKYIDLLLESFEKQPDKNKKADLLKEAFDKIRSESERTGLKGTAIYKKIKNPPEGLTVGKAASIVGNGKKASRKHLEAIIDAYAQQPDAPKFVLLSKYSKKLKQEAERTGLGPSRILQTMKSIPDGLTSTIIGKMSSGETKSQKELYVKAVLDAYAQQPSMNEELCSQEQRKELLLESKRTGLGGTALFSLIDNPPKGLNSPLANVIVSGVKKDAEKIHVKSLLDTYRKQPNKEARFSSKEEQDLIREEAKRTGLGGIALFKKIASPPKGLTPSKANEIACGRGKKSPKEYFEAMIKCYQEQPSNTQSSPTPEHD